MIASLAQEQPVYAVDMERLCGTKQNFTIEQIAEFYCEVIQTISTSGPYNFCGYSFGGLVAYEMARQLINQGHDVNLVALLDAPNPALVSQLSTTAAVQFHKTYLLDRLRIYGRYLVNGNVRGFMKRGIAFVVSRAGNRFMPLIKVGFRMMKTNLPVMLRNYDPALLKAYNSYSPKPYPKSIVCFRGDRGPEHDQDASMGWNTCAMGGVQIHVLPGGHADIMRMPSAKVIAKTLTAYLDHGASHPEDVFA